MSHTQPFWNNLRMCCYQNFHFLTLWRHNHCKKNPSVIFKRNDEHLKTKLAFYPSLTFKSRDDSALKKRVLNAKIPKTLTSPTLVLSIDKEQKLYEFQLNKRINGCLPTNCGVCNLQHGYFAGEEVKLNRKYYCYKCLKRMILKRHFGRMSHISLQFFHCFRSKRFFGWSYTFLLNEVKSSTGFLITWWLCFSIVAHLWIYALNIRPHL